MKVRIAYVGICGSDIQRLDMGQDIRTLGHEIVAVNGAVAYAVNPLVSCGVCHHCVQGETRFCESLASIGKDEVGGFSGGSIDIPTRNLTEIPEKSATYTLADPLACVIHGIKYLADMTDTSVLVIGDGVMALLFVELLKKGGARVTQAIKSFNHRQRVHPDVATVIFGDTPLEAYDAVVVCVGGTHSHILNYAIRVVKSKGDLLVVGAYHSLEDSIDIKPLLKKEIAFRGTFSYEPEDFQRAVCLIAERPDRFRSFVSDIFPASELDAAIQHDRNSGTRHKVAISFD